MLVKTSVETWGRWGGACAQWPVGGRPLRQCSCEVFGKGVWQEKNISLWTEDAQWWKYFLSRVWLFLCTLNVSRFPSSLEHSSSCAAVCARAVRIVHTKSPLARSSAWQMFVLTAKRTLTPDIWIWETTDPCAIKCLSGDDPLAWAIPRIDDAPKKKKHHQTLGLCANFVGFRSFPNASRAGLGPSVWEATNEGNKPASVFGVHKISCWHVCVNNDENNIGNISAKHER